MHVYACSHASIHFTCEILQINHTIVKSYEVHRTLSDYNFVLPLKQIIRMLTEKCKNQEAIIAEYEIQEQEWQDLQEEAGILRQQVEATR